MVGSSLSCCCEAWVISNDCKCMGLHYIYLRNFRHTLGICPRPSITCSWRISFHISILGFQGYTLYIVGIYWGFLLLKASNRGVKQLGYHPKGTTIFPNGKCMGYIYHTWILWVDDSEIQLTTWGRSLVNPIIYKVFYTSQVVQDFWTINRMGCKSNNLNVTKKKNVKIKFWFPKKDTNDNFSNQCLTVIEMSPSKHPKRGGIFPWSSSWSHFVGKCWEGPPFNQLEKNN